MCQRYDDHANTEDRLVGTNCLLSLCVCVCAYTDTDLVHEALVGATHHFIAVEVGVGLELVAVDASPIDAVVG